MRMRKKLILIFMLSIIWIMTTGMLVYKSFSWIEGELVGVGGQITNEPFWTQAKPGDIIEHRISVDDWRSRWWFCMQHNNSTPFNGNGNFNLIRTIINVDANVSENGYYKTEINRGDGTGKTAVVNDTTKKLAYLIYAATQDYATGYPSQGTRSKKQLYNFIISGLTEEYLGKFYYKLNRSVDLGNQAIIDSYANTYSRTYSTGSSADITEKSDTGAKVTVKNVNGTTYSYMGPFSMKTQGSIDSVSINDGGRSVSVAGYASTLGGAINTDVTGINKNGNPFYIVAQGSLTSLNPTVTIKTKGSAGGGTVTNPKNGTQSTGYIKARIIFIGTNAFGSQATAVFRGELQPTSPSSDSETFTAKNDLGKMTVTKTGMYTGNEEYEKVSGFAFKIFRLDGTTRRYLRVNNQAEIKNQAVVSISLGVSYTESADNATVFYTHNGGTVSIDNISIEYKYYIEEIETDETNYDIELIKATTQIGDGEVTELELDGNVAGPITVELKGSGSSGQKVTLVNLSDYRKTGRLTIEKVDSDTYDTKLGKVKFILRNTDTGRYVKANRTSDGMYTVEDPFDSYTDNKDEATIFETNSRTGKIRIEDLDVGNYEITETENPNYGYVISTEGEKDITTTVVKADDSANEIIRNEKYTGNLQILKRDADTGKPMENVSFVIRKRTSTSDDINGKGDVNADGFIDMDDMRLVLRYVTDKFELTEEQLKEADLNEDGIVNITDLRMLMQKVNSDYVIAMENKNTGSGETLTALDTVVGTKYLDGMTTTESRDEATVFKTDVRGLIQIYNILEGDYIIDEIDVGDNNYGYDIDDNYISWDVNGKTIEGKTAIVTVERQRSYNTVEFSTVIEDDQKTLEDGLYRIPSLNGNRTIDLYYENQSDGAQIAWHPIQNVGNNPAQEFYLKYAGGGQYYIISSSSGKYLTASNEQGRLTVVAYPRSENRVQKWEIKKEGNGYTIAATGNRNYTMTGTYRPDGKSYDYKIDLVARSFVYNDSQLFTFESLTTQSDSGTITTATANNRRKYIKISGYVWEDISWESGKVYDSNGLYQAINDDKNDKLVGNVTVKLKDKGGNTIPFKDINGNTVTEILTDERETVEEIVVSGDAVDNGDGTALGPPISVTQVENTNYGKYTMTDVLIDNLDEYYIEFSYNGIAYESVPITYIYNPRGTDAIEGENIRDRYNENFAQITDNESGANGYSGQSNNSNGQKVNDIRYNQGSYSSSINYEGNYLYGYSDEKITEVQPYTGISVQDYKTYYPVNGVANKYIISSSTFEAYRSAGQSGFLSDIIDADSIRDNGTEEIGATFENGINLGIKKRERPDLSVVKDLDRATVNVAGTQHVYIYGDRFNSELWADEKGTKGHGLDPIVKFEEKYAEMTYSRPLYASDIYYDGNEKEQLSVKLTYKISVRNNSTNINAQIYELDDYFDEKFNLIAVGTDIDDFGSIKEGTEITDNTEVTQINNEYKKVTIGNENTPVAEMEPLTEKFIYLQFSVDKADIIDIIQEDDEYVKLDNIAEIKRYGLTKTNEKGEEKVYAGIDKDSQPGNADPADRSTFEDDTDKAPGLGLTFQKEREVKGKVFIDQDINPVDTDKEVEVHTGIARQGNGQYDENEKGVENVKVTLREPNGDIAEVYNADIGEYEEAITYTDENGEYTFGGFLPGEYYVQYSWGGNIDGEGITSTYTLDNGEEEIVNVQNYKSTVVNDEVWSEKANTDKWYNDDFKKRFPGVEWNNETNTEIRTSDAVDDYQTRLEIDEETSTMTYSEKQKFENTYNENSTGEKYTNTQMNSNTQGFSVYIEYVDVEDIRQNITDQQDEYYIDEENNKTEKEEFKTTINSIDFGIVERSRQVLELRKLVNSVKITLTNGNILINAKLNENGELVDFTQYVTAVPSSPAANGQINVQIDEELLQGATVEIDYGLEVINISELDYQTEEFYNYGVGNGEDASKVSTLRPTLIIDYLNNNLINSQDTWEIVEKENRVRELIDTGLLSESLKDMLLDTQRVELTKELQYEALVPEGLEGDVGNSKATVTVNLEASRLLSGNDEETFTENNAEIITVEKDNGGSVLITTPGNYNPNDSSTSEVDDATSQGLVILPPTGLETNYIAYALLAISSLGIVVAGVILIKKFVIK